MIRFIERLFFAPKKSDYIIIALLLPFSFIYGFFALCKRVFSKEKNFNIKIISIGNLIVGGSGKTPFAIALIKHFQNQKKIAYISRGYGRKSKGFVIVKEDGVIKSDVFKSGDEAMLVALECQCDVFVSEDRSKAIEYAKKKGIDFIVLDDAFSKPFKKFDILLEPKEIKNYLPFPAGPFREFYFLRKKAHIIAKEGKDFKRKVIIPKSKEPLLLVSAIANAKRLNPYLPSNIVGKLILTDHSFFDKKQIIQKMKEVKAKKILCTQKDYVKLQNFKLPTLILSLQLQINKNILKKIEDFINGKQDSNSSNTT